MPDYQHEKNKHLKSEVKKPNLNQANWIRLSLYQTFTMLIQDGHKLN